jgi:hypothetical protein
MRVLFAAPCLSLVLAAAGCSHATPAAPPPAVGVTNLQPEPDDIDDRGRTALLDAQYEVFRLQALHDESADVTLRDALVWQIDAIEKRMDALLGDMTSVKSSGNASAMREDIGAMERETLQGKNTEGWAKPGAKPRSGNAETMPRSSAPAR